MSKEIIDLAIGALKNGQDAIEELIKNFPSQSFTELINYISNDLKGKVVVAGLGKSGDVAKRLATTLTSTGTPAVFLHCTEASHGDMGIIGDDDCVIAISNSGETKEMNNVIDYTRRFGVKLIAICNNPESTLGKNADLNITIPDLPELCLIGKAPTTSIVLLSNMVNAIVVSMERQKGLTCDMYVNWHPNGKLGASIKKVAELMHTGEELPIVSVGTPMPEVLDVMSRKVRFGCVGVIDNDGRLAGIFTDGDIRRRLVEGVMDLTDKKIEDVMGKSPKTITSDSLASSALLEMNEKKIQMLFVVDNDNKPVGVINFHDLLKAGIM